MEIKVGEYVRTTTGVIAKIKDETYEDYQERGDIIYTLDKEAFDETEGYEEYSFYALPDQFIKHSPNIIDLIECNDYVNGERVTAIYDEYKNDGHIKLETNYEGRYRDYINEDIKSIVTKEQFNQMKYIVGDESNVKD